MIQPNSLLAKLDKLKSNRSKYQILKLLVATKARHLLRSLPISRPPVSDFCTGFDHSMQNLFASSFNLHNPSPQVLAQITLSTSHGGMGILPLTDIAPAACIASLHKLISEFVA